MPRGSLDLVSVRSLRLPGQQGLRRVPDGVQQPIRGLPGLLDDICGVRDRAGATMGGRLVARRPYRGRDRGRSRRLQPDAGRCGRRAGDRDGPDASTPSGSGPGDDRVEPLLQAFRTAADLPACEAVVMRHVLEHVDDPVALLTGLRGRLTSHPTLPVLVEIPDATRILTEGAFWDVYYEHCAYLTSATARALFESCGFAVRAHEQCLRRPVPAGRGHCLRDTPTGPAGRGGVVVTARSGQRFRRAVDTVRWTELVETSARHAAPAGSSCGERAPRDRPSSSRSGRRRAAVDCVVDINPHLNGKFIAGTGHPIFAPRRPRAGCAVTSSIVMNPVYVAEIREELQRLGCRPALVALGPTAAATA